MTIGLGERMRVFAYDQPCDMRKSFNTLSGLVAEMDREVTQGDAFLFVSRNRKRAKVLWFDGTGLCLLAKRLDTGQFSAVWENGKGAIELTVNELRLFIEGCRVVGRLRLSPDPIDIDSASRVPSSLFN